MKLAERLKSELKKTLVLTVSLGVVALILSIASSTIQIKNRANQFLFASISEIAKSEVASQNVGDIDREVRKLYDAWKATQEMDTRIEIYSNGRLISNAGPLTRFGPLSYSKSKTFPLPDGSDLKVNVDLDLTSQILLDLLTFAIFLMFIGSGYFLVKRLLYRLVRTISEPLEERVAWLTSASKVLSNSVHKFPDFNKTDIEEVLSLDASLKLFVEQIEALEVTLAKSSFDKGQVQMAEKFAHNTKGSLAVLHMRIDNAMGLSQEDRKVLNAAVNRVSESSEKLLKANPAVPSNFKVNFTAVDLAVLLEKIIQDRKDLLGIASHIQVSLHKNFSDSAVIVFISETEVASALNNILDNAVEAIKEPGEIKVFLTVDKQTAEISISDNGHGIPKNILNRLMSERITFGKPDGNGFGLLHSKQTIEEAKGKIVLHSEVGVGTEVRVSLPLHQQTFSKDIVIPIAAGATLVILDDQELIHQTVNLMLKDRERLDLVHLHSIEEFENWFSANGQSDLGSRTYWMDYDLQHPSQTGLSLIERYSLQFESYLITGVAEDPKIIERTKKENIRLISKSDIPKIQFLIKPMSETQEIVLEQGRG